MCDTMKDMWDSMRKKYKGSIKVKCEQLQALCKEFEVPVMKVGESVDDYLQELLPLLITTTRGEKMEKILVDYN